MRKLVLIASVLVAALILAPLAGTPARADGPTDILSLIQSDKELSTLGEAIKVGGLEDYLGLGGPYTLLAPTNAAFDAAFKDLKTTKEDFFKDSGAVASTLVYHVLTGTFTSKLLLKDMSAYANLATWNMGQPVTFSAKDKSVFVNDARITTMDLRIKNGIVHKIDKLLTPKAAFVQPKAEMDYSMPLDKLDGYKTFQAAVKAAPAVSDILTKAAGMTVFAPTDEAFTYALSVLKITPEQLLKDPTLPRLLFYHVMPFVYPAEWLKNMDGVFVGTLVEDTLIAITVKDSVITLNGSVHVVAPDIPAIKGGFLHGIDGLLLPPRATDNTTPVPTAAATAVATAAK